MAYAYFNPVETTLALTIESGLSEKEKKNFFTELSANVTAKHLALSISFSSFDEGIQFTEALAENVTLQSLGLDYSSFDIPDYDISLACASIRSKSLHRLWLEVQGNYMGSDCGTKLAKGLSENTCPQLKKLFLKNNLLGDAGVSAIGIALRHNTTLEVLKLQDNGVGCKGGREIAKAVSVNSSLVHINLNSNNVGTAGAVELGKALTKNTTLKKLSLRGNKIGAGAGQVLGEALSINQTLEQLNLSLNKLADSGVVGLSTGLQTNKGLKILNLHSNGFGPDCALAISEALRVNETLTVLDLGSNRIGAGMEPIASALEKNCTLVELILMKVYIFDVQVGELARSLHCNTALRRLVLSKNALGSEAAFELAKMLEVNHTLQCLILRGNYIKTDGMCELGKSLAKNAGLEVLDLALNAADAQVLSGIAQGLQENYTLQELALGYIDFSSPTITPNARQYAEELLLSLENNFTLSKIWFDEKFMNSNVTREIYDQIEAIMNRNEENRDTKRFKTMKGLVPLDSV